MDYELDAHLETQFEDRISGTEEEETDDWWADEDYDEDCNDEE